MGDKEKQSAYNHEYYVRNRERLMAQHREYGRKHWREAKTTKVKKERPRLSIEERRAHDNEHARNRHLERKAQGRCVVCGKEAVDGRTLCSACAKKRSIYSHAYYERNHQQGGSRHKTREEINASRREYYKNVGNKKIRERYLDLKSRGICVYCGKAPAVEGKVSCHECIAKQKLKYRNKKKAQESNE